MTHYDGISDEPDGELVKRTLQGDERAFQVLVNRYNATVRGIILHEVQINNASDLDDVVQDIFLRAWSSLSSLKSPEKFKSWLSAIAHNTAIDYRRKRDILRQRISDDERDKAIAYEVSVPSRETELVQVDDTQQFLTRLRKALPLKEYQCYVLDINGWEKEEIAKRTGIKVSSVPVYISKARIKAREIRAQMLREQEESE